MEANYSPYDFPKSLDRISEVLQSADSSYTEKSSIPSRNSLTFNNGVYVNCSAIFIDIRESKSLSKNHTRPVQAKIYKTYISELIAILKSHTKISEIYIEGDSVWGVCDTPLKSDINELFIIGAKMSSLIDVLNIKYRKRGYTELTVGIGMSFGSSLLIKAGYKGSGINEVVWLGKLVNEAALLCSYGNKTQQDAEMMVSASFYQHLSSDNKNLLSINYSRNCYHGNVFNVVMNNWVIKNRN